jgi:hypothetical protein
MKIASRLAALVLAIFAAPAGALPISFRKIAGDSGHPAWNSPVLFSIPAVDDGEVAFLAEHPSLSGIDTGSGGALTTVVDSNMLIPDTSQPFQFFERRPSISNGNVAFLVNENGGYPAVFASLDGTVTRIADSTTPEPGGNGSLVPDYQRAPAIDGHNVAFMAWNEAIVRAWRSIPQ